MINEAGQNIEHSQYREFWQDNIEKLDEVVHRIEGSFFRLEKKYSEFDSIYDELLRQLDLLISMYSCFNNLLGIDYLMKLKSLLLDYRKRYTHEGISFNVIYYLHAKVIELRDSSFSNFPALPHAEKPAAELDAGKAAPVEAPFKWVTFTRNGSWFITRFDTVRLVRFEDAEQDISETDGYMYIRHDGKRIRVEDMFSRYVKGGWERPDCYVIVGRGNEQRCYAASATGRRIYSRNDIFAKKIKSVRGESMMKGFLRIFGKNHIVLA
jgi:hypothetical protein